MIAPRTALIWLTIAGVAMVALTIAGLYCESHDQMAWYYNVAPDHLPWFIETSLE